MFARMEEGNSIGVCGTMAMCERTSEILQFSDEIPANLSAAGEMRSGGGFGGYRPCSMERRVLLPDPDGPTMAVQVPAQIRRDMLDNVSAPNGRLGCENDRSVNWIGSGDASRLAPRVS